MRPFVGHQIRSSISLQRGFQSLAILHHLHVLALNKSGNDFMRRHVAPPAGVPELQ
jgi:hypothetical protein